MTGRGQRIYLTADGRRLLEERIVSLQATAEELRLPLGDPESRADSVGEYQRVTRDLERLQWLVDCARPIDDLPDDPGVVELGDAVWLRLEDGVEETYVIVHACEAPVDDQRISMESPLGGALLGRRVGETVEVRVSHNPYRCTILSATRADG